MLSLTPKQQLERQSAEQLLHIYRHQKYPKIMSLQKTLWVWSLTCHYANACQHLCIEVFKFTHKPAIGSTRKALRYSSLLTNQSRLNPKSLKFHYIIWWLFAVCASGHTLPEHRHFVALLALQRSKETCPRRTKRELWPSHLLSLPTKMVMDQNWGATYQIGPAFTSYNILNLIHLIRSIRIYSVY